jgi:hypothetical protein
VHYSALYASFELKKCYYKSSLSFMYLCHRVDRVLGFFNPVLRIGTPHPFTRRRMCPPLLFRERGWGGGGPNSDDGIDTVVLYVGIWELCARNSFRTILCSKTQNRRFLEVFRGGWFGTNSEHLYLTRNGSEQNY